MTTSASTTGASWLLGQPDPESTFTPEQLSEEHRLMAQTVEEFMATEVLPQIDQLETKDWALARRLVRRRLCHGWHQISWVVLQPRIAPAQTIYVNRPTGLRLPLKAAST